MTGAKPCDGTGVLHVNTRSQKIATCQVISVYSTCTTADNRSTNGMTNVSAGIWIWTGERNE